MGTFETEIYKLHLRLAALEAGKTVANLQPSDSVIANSEIKAPVKVVPKPAAIAPPISAPPVKPPAPPVPPAPVAPKVPEKVGP
jgi:hypothetical protein